MDIIELYEVDSTNEYAKKQITAELEDNLVVWSHRQTAGKGRQGNVWESPEGNLYTSFVIKPKLEPQLIGQLSFMSAVAIAGVLETIMPEHAEKIQLKWPNDVLIDGKKLCGILVEKDSNSDWVVVGMGVNIATCPEGKANLYDLDVRISVKDFLEKLIIEFSVSLATLEHNGFEPIQKDWMKRAYRLNQEIRAKLPKETLKGIFRGIDNNGVLSLELPDGTLRDITSGEVFL